MAEADTIEAIKMLVAEATLQVREARHRKDQAAEMIAMAKRLGAQRKGGQLFLAGSRRRDQDL
jgi:hypothetical protein